MVVTVPSDGFAQRAKLKTLVFKNRWGHDGDYSSHGSRGQGEKQGMVVTVPSDGFAQRAKLKTLVFKNRWGHDGDYSSHGSRSQGEEQRLVVTVPFVGFAQRAKLKTLVFKNKWGHGGDYSSHGSRGQGEKQRMVVTVPSGGFAQRAKSRCFAPRRSDGDTIATTRRHRVDRFQPDLDHANVGKRAPPQQGGAGVHSVGCILFFCTQNCAERERSFCWDSI